MPLHVDECAHELDVRERQSLMAAQCTQSLYCSTPRESRQVADYYNQEEEGGGKGDRKGRVVGSQWEARFARDRGGSCVGGAAAEPDVILYRLLYRDKAYSNETARGLFSIVRTHLHVHLLLCTVY